MLVTLIAVTRASNKTYLERRDHGFRVSSTVLWPHRPKQNMIVLEACDGGSLYGIQKSGS